MRLAMEIRIITLSPENRFASHPPAAVAVEAAVTAALLPTELAVLMATAEPLLTELTTATDRFCKANIPAVPGEAGEAVAGADGCAMPCHDKRTVI